jgi:HEPN domain-containing protein
MKAATRDWVKKAEGDYLAAIALARKRKIPLHDQVCFHCQQSAEKYLKARMEEAGIPSRKTHNLEKLLALAVTIEPLWSTLKNGLKR